MFLYQPPILKPFVADNDGSIWSDCILVMVDHYRMRLVIIGFTIETRYSSHKSDF